LIETTKQQLLAGPLPPNSIVKNLWQYLCQEAQAQSAEAFVKRIIGAAIGERVRRNRDAFFPFVSLLYSLLENDPMSTRVIGQEIQNLVEKLGNEEKPGFLTTLKRLVGRGLTLSAAPPLRPKLTQIEQRPLVPYLFESSLYPLTVYDNATLRGIFPRKLKEQALEPFVFEIVSRSGEALFNELASEVASILYILNDTFENDGEHCWDVPTICEWLSLAGCDRHIRMG
jgi:hypothetical protein